MEREGVNTLPICSYLRALRCLAHFENTLCFCVFLECWFALAFVFAKCRGKQESLPSFILCNKERTKAQKNSFSRVF